MRFEPLHSMHLASVGGGGRSWMSAGHRTVKSDCNEHVGRVYQSYLRHTPDYENQVLWCRGP
jgi:hypothetical protein